MSREFGGLGGITGGREFNEQDLFERAVAEAFGERLKSDGPGDGPAFTDSPGLGARIWGSLANVNWRHENGDVASYSFRAAGDLIAAIVGSGDYMDWYCSAEYGVVDPEFAAAMKRLGWAPILVEKS